MECQSYHKYPGLYKIINLLDKYLSEINKQDIDSFIIFTLLYGYTCKYLKLQDYSLTKENIYNFMEMIWNNPENRSSIINYYHHIDGFSLNENDIKLIHK